MTTTRFFTNLTPQALAAIEKIKQDPCFTSDPRQIEMCAKYFTHSTLITQHPQGANRFNVSQKHSLDCLSLPLERELIIESNGQIKIKSNGKEVREHIQDYLFSDKALQLFKTLQKISHQEKPVFTPAALESKHLSTLVLQTQFQPEEKEINVLVLWNKVKITPQSVSYLLQIHRNSSVTCYAEIKGNIAGTKEVIDKSFLIKALDDIPEKRMREYYEAVILPLTDTQCSLIRSKL